MGKWERHEMREGALEKCSRGGSMRLFFEGTKAHGKRMNGGG